MLPHALVGISSYAFLQSLMVQIPIVFAQPPYSLPAGLIGVSAGCPADSACYLVWLLAATGPMPSCHNMVDNLPVSCE